MHVRCPHCNSPIELLDDQPLTDIVCPSCDSGFSLVDSETRVGRDQILDGIVKAAPTAPDARALCRQKRRELIARVGGLNEGKTHR